MKIRFEEMRSPEIGGLIAKNGMVIIPVGACEEHGRHLPVSTDTIIAYEAAIDAASIVAGTIPIAVLPAVWFGYTVAMLKNWPGTITVKPKVLIDLLYDICRSLIDMGIKKMLIVNGHGNNPGVLDIVVRSIGDDFKVFPAVVNVFNLWDKEYIKKNRKSGEGGIGHAGELETSLILHFDEDLVDMSVADNTDMMKSDLKYCPVDMASDKKKKYYLSTWYLENSTHGGAGDPTDARKDLGAEIHKMTVALLTEVIREFYDIQVKLEKRALKRKNTKF